MQQKLLRKIKNEFPELKWQKSQFLNVGWDHYVIILDNSIVFRFPKVSEYKDEFENEIKLLKFLKGYLTAPIPDYIYISKDYKFAGYKMIKEKEFKPSIFRKLEKRDKTRFINDIATFINQLHVIPLIRLKKFGIKNDKNRELKFVTFFEKEMKKYAYSRVSTKDYQKMMDFLDEMRLAIQGIKNRVLVHSDLGWEHIMTKNNRMSGVIDFSDRCITDPAMDFAGLWDYGSKFVNEVYKRYQGPKDENLLYRSRVYYKRVPIIMISDSFKGYPCTFEESYKLFKQRFNN